MKILTSLSCTRFIFTAFIADVVSTLRYSGREFNVIHNEPLTFTSSMLLWTFNCACHFCLAWLHICRVNVAMVVGLMWEIAFGKVCLGNIRCVQLREGWRTELHFLIYVTRSQNMCGLFTWLHAVGCPLCGHIVLVTAGPGQVQMAVLFDRIISLLVQPLLSKWTCWSYGAVILCVTQ